LHHWDRHRTPAKKKAVILSSMAATQNTMKRASCRSIMGREVIFIRRAREKVGNRQEAVSVAPAIPTHHTVTSSKLRNKIKRL